MAVGESDALARRQGGGNGRATEADRMLSVHFTWNGAVKEVSSVMMGRFVG